MVFFISIFICLLVLNPEISVNATLEGSKLFFFNVFPSLFIFAVLCNLIILLNGIDIYSKMFGRFLCKPLNLPNVCATPIIITILCGYPLGSKYSGDLYRKGLIDYKTFKRLVVIASTPSPIFVIGAVGLTMLNDVRYGYLLLFSIYISGFLMSLFTKSKPLITSETKNISINKAKPLEKLVFSDALTRSITQAIKTCLTVAGFIIFFSVLSSILNKLVFVHIKGGLVSYIFYGILEMTYGCKIISTALLPNAITISIIAFFLEFGGLCILSQCYSFIHDLKINFFYFVSWKIFYGLLNSAVTLSLFLIFF